MPSELDEVRLHEMPKKNRADVTQLVEFLHHGNTQIRQIGIHPVLFVLFRLFFSVIFVLSPECKKS